MYFLIEDDNYDVILSGLNFALILTKNLIESLPTLEKF